MDGGAWQAIVHGITKSPTRLSDFTSLHRELISHVLWFRVAKKMRRKQNSFLQQTSSILMHMKPESLTFGFFAPHTTNQPPFPSLNEQ